MPDSPLHGDWAVPIHVSIPNIVYTDLKINEKLQNWERQSAQTPASFRGSERRYAVVMGRRSWILLHFQYAKHAGKCGAVSTNAVL